MTRRTTENKPYYRQHHSEVAVKSSHKTASVNDLSAKAASHMGAGFARSGQLADYLQVSARTVTPLVSQKFLIPNQAGRFMWADIWWQLWRIRSVPSEAFQRMQEPVITNADVADLLGVHERSVRRDGLRSKSRYELPPHLDLSERISRHHPMRIEIWEQGASIPNWLQPIQAGRHLNLIGRKTPVSDK